VLRSPDEEARPFDRCRNGFTGGFLVLLESASAAAARGARVYGEILGVGAAASSTSVNGWPLDSSGLIKAMRLALSDGQLGPDDVAAVMATANGSPLLDLLEAAAIGEVFGARQPAWLRSRVRSANPEPLGPPV
jgi:3-oxoacyl-(acyl-carrier-protein) synthase